MGTQKGREAYELLKMGALDGMSIGFKADPEIVFIRSIFQGKISCDVSLENNKGFISFQSGMFPSKFGIIKATVFLLIHLSICETSAINLFSKTPIKCGIKPS